MKRYFEIPSFTLIGFLLLCFALTPEGKAKEWNWKDGSGQTRTRAELQEILEKNELWVKSKGKTGMPANLSGVSLRNVDLGEAFTHGAFGGRAT